MLQNWSVTTFVDHELQQKYKESRSTTIGYHRIYTSSNSSLSTCSLRLFLSTNTSIYHSFSSFYVLRSFLGAWDIAWYITLGSRFLPYQLEFLQIYTLVAFRKLTFGTKTRAERLLTENRQWNEFLDERNWSRFKKRMIRYPCKKSALFQILIHLLSVSYQDFVGWRTLFNAA